MARAGYMLTLLGLMSLMIEQFNVVRVLDHDSRGEGVVRRINWSHAHVERRRIQQSIVLEYKRGYADWADDLIVTQ